MIQGNLSLGGKREELSISDPDLTTNQLCDVEQATSPHRPSVFSSVKWAALDNVSFYHTIPTPPANVAAPTLLPSFCFSNGVEDTSSFVICSAVSAWHIQTTLLPALLTDVQDGPLH